MCTVSNKIKSHEYEVKVMSSPPPKSQTVTSTLLSSRTLSCNLWKCVIIISSNLVGLVEKEAEVGEDHPEFLPPVTVLELSQQVPGELVLERDGQRWEDEEKKKMMFLPCLGCVLA